ncbi:MAG: DEAD/DEAH box helicase family protein [Syntrophobacteraceae bacterium]
MGNEAFSRVVIDAQLTDQGWQMQDPNSVPYIFLANGKEILFWEWENEAFPRPVKTFFKQTDLEKRFATRQVEQDPFAVPIDERIAGGGGRDYQRACIDKLCEEIGQGRRKLLVEMATGTGKTRTAAAFMKRKRPGNTIFILH